MVLFDDVHQGHDPANAAAGYSWAENHPCHWEDQIEFFGANIEIIANTYWTEDLT